MEALGAALDAYDETVFVAIIGLAAIWAFVGLMIMKGEDSDG